MKVNQLRRRAIFGHSLIVELDRQIALKSQLHTYYRNTGMMSVCTKSSPLNNSGSPVARAKA
jgi:hypothetical protein